MTDHNPLECIFSLKSKSCARIERWLLRMRPYKFWVQYILGPKNIRFPSCLFHPTTNSGHKIDRWVIKAGNPRVHHRSCLNNSLNWDPRIPLNWEKYLHIRGELCAIGKLVLRGTLILVPKELRRHVLELVHEGHPGTAAMKQQLGSKVWWPRIDKDAARMRKTCHGCQLVSQPLKPEPMTRREFPWAP